MLAAEAELKRLCEVESKVKNLQQALRGLPNHGRSKVDGSTSTEQSIVYVPVAETTLSVTLPFNNSLRCLTYLPESVGVDAELKSQIISILSVVGDLSLRSFTIYSSGNVDRYRPRRKHSNDAGE
ncbi:Hypothetical predicted protein [Olea europaea subsp. europaea]|uniref:Uncharacterized protein n=1 Tax=Olea europaea subsp. europaea TaxID=158383 RepID=A0A8S0TAJ4_OLEEU|nr:Hypothetical predicted protein [Olea europaea subsp. europaea]